MQEPRLAPLPFAEWDETTRTTLLQFLRRPEVYLSGDPDAPPMPIVLEMFAHHLALSASWLPFTEMLAGPDAKLSAEHRELLILRVSWRTRSGYEWAQHSRMGADAGLQQRADRRGSPKAPPRRCGPHWNGPCSPRSTR